MLTAQSVCENPVSVAINAFPILLQFAPDDENRNRTYEPIFGPGGLTEAQLKQLARRLSML